MSEKGDKEISRWWGRWVESSGSPDALARALDVYAAVGADGDRVRVLLAQARGPPPRLPCFD